MQRDANSQGMVGGTKDRVPNCPQRLMSDKFRRVCKTQGLPTKKPCILPHRYLGQASQHVVGLRARIASRILTSYYVCCLLPSAVLRAPEHLSDATGSINVQDDKKSKSYPHLDKQGSSEQCAPILRLCCGNELQNTHTRCTGLPRGAIIPTRHLRTALRLTKNQRA